MYEMESKLIHSCNRAAEFNIVQELLIQATEKGNTKNIDKLNRYLKELSSACAGGYNVYRPPEIEVMLR